MNRVLSIDIGNTNTKFAIVGEDYYEYLGFIPSKTITEPFKFSIDIEDVKSCIISSVAPSKTKIISNYFEMNNVKPSFIPIDQGVGADLYASMQYAKKYFDLPCIVFSLGTATTCYVLDDEGEMQGGLIIPGIMPSIHSLSQETENLPEFIPKLTDKFLEFSTIGAMNSGIIYGYAAMIDGLVNKVSEEYNIKTSALSGGMSPLISNYVQTPHILERDIVLKGAYIYYANTNANKE